jgi:hypothetical protein
MASVEKLTENCTGMEEIVPLPSQPYDTPTYLPLREPVLLKEITYEAVFGNIIFLASSISQTAQISHRLGGTFLLDLNNVISIAYLGAEYVRRITCLEQSSLWQKAASIIIGSGFIMRISANSELGVVTLHTRLATKVLNMSYDEFAELHTVCRQFDKLLPGHTESLSCLAKTHFSRKHCSMSSM